MKKSLIPLTLAALLFGAGCGLPRSSSTQPSSPTQPESNQTGQAESATTTTDQNANTTQTSPAGAIVGSMTKDGVQWQTYRNDYYGFEVSFPGSSIDNPAREGGISLPNANTTEARNLTITLTEKSDIPDDETFCPSKLEGYESSGEIIWIGQNRLCLQKYADPGMNQLDTHYDYSFRSDKGETTLYMTVHSVSNPSIQGDCKEGPAKAARSGWKTPDCLKYVFDEKRDTALFGEIMSTFKVLGQQGTYALQPRTMKADEKYYTYTLSYPEMTGLADAKIQDAFNERMKYEMTTSSSNFVDYYADVDKEHFTDAWRGSFDMEYTVQQHGQLLSIVFTGSEFTGGAHPAHINQTYVFDMRTGRFLTLPNLFKDGTDYLKTISDKSIAQIAKLNIGDPDWNRKGAAPDAQNFQLFWLDDTGLNIVFPPYQVASYAEGEHTVTIPYTELNGIMLPEILDAR